MSPSHIVEGDRGTGKSMFPLIYIIEEQDEREILSNMSLEIEDRKIRQLTIMDFINLGEEEDKILILDEGYLWWEARSSGKDQNKLMSYQNNFSRKTNNEAFITTQEIGFIDLRGRLQFDRRILCSKICKCRDPCRTCTKERISERGQFRYTILNSRNKVLRRKILSGRNAATLFDCFNTNEVLKPPDFERMKSNVLRKTEPFQVFLTVERYARDVLPTIRNKTRQGKKLTKSLINIALMEHNIPDVWSTDVYDYIVAYT